MFIGELDQSLMHWLKDARIARENNIILVGDQTSIIRWLIETHTSREEAWGKAISYPKLPPRYVIEALEALIFGLNEHFWRGYLRPLHKSLLQDLLAAETVWADHPCVYPKIVETIALIERLN